MATIDSNIALGVKPVQVENPMNQYAALSQIQNAQNQNALAQYQLSSAQRAEEGQNALSGAYRKAYNSETGKVDNTLLRQEIANSGHGYLLPKVEAGILTQQKDEATLNKTIADTDKIKYEQKMKQYDRAISHIGSLNTPQEAIASIDSSLAKGDIDQNKADMLKQSLAQAGANFLGWKKNILMGSMDAKDQLHQDYQNTMAKIAGGNLAVNQSRLGIEQNKANREQTMGTIPAGYRLSKDGTTLEAMPGGPTTVALPPKEIQKRETLFPQAQQSVKTVSNTMSVIGQTIDSLLANETGIDRITGLISGNTPAISDSARKAKAEVEQLKNLAFVQGITELRAASKTGAGVGNVTNREGDRFENLKASLDRAQSKEDFIAALKKLKQQAEITSQYTNEAFNETYDYRNNAGATQPAPSNPIAPAPSGTKKPSLDDIFKPKPKP
jgi:hypothetical protein